MQIHGFQKLTLLDYPGKVAATVFTAGCNLRCPFCHNAFLVTQIDSDNEFSQQEILDVLKNRKKVLDGVCITGGEPLIYEDTLEFIKKIKQIGLAVKLDTNGTFPLLLQKAVESGDIDYVAMDIKNCKTKYALTTGIDGLDIEPICQSVEFLKSGKVDYEFRTTVIEEFHDTQDIEQIGQWIEGADKYFLQNFVDSGNLISNSVHGCDSKKMQKLLEIARKYVPNAALRGI